MKRPKPDFESQLDYELTFHIDKLTEEKIAAGIPPDEARRQAVLKFGGVEQFKEELRDLRGSRFLETLLSNLRGAVRVACKRPSLSLTIIATLALGIGANTAVFSAIDAILLRPMPFPNGDQLMQITQYSSKGKGGAIPAAPARVEDWNRMNSTFQAITGYYTQDVAETSGILPEKITQAWVAPRFFEVWGVAPALGRSFLQEEERGGGGSLAVISDHLWRRRFGASPDAVGRILRNGAESFRIVGVMPASFLFPNRDVEFWTPVPLNAPVMRTRNANWYTIFGRLKPGVTLAQARSDIAVVQSQLGKQYPQTDADLHTRVESLKKVTVGDSGRSLWILFGAVTMLLLIACTNIAALLLARTTERQREIAIRSSLGASRGSILAQLLTEIFVLALAGAAAALAVAAGTSHLFQTMARNLPRVDEIAPNARLVLYTVACAAVTTLLCGLFPAIRATRHTLNESLAHGGRTQVAGRNPLQWALSGLQVALAVILLAGAGLLLRSFDSLAHVSPGFESAHVLTLRISASWAESVDFNRTRQRINRDIEALGSIPGVEGAATSGTLPGLPSGTTSELAIVDAPVEPGRKIMAASHNVSPGYFAAMRIPLLAGRDCPEQPMGAALVNRNFADAYMAGRLPMGNHLQFVPASPYLMPGEIRGVVSNAREEGIEQDPVPIVYWCNSAPTPMPVFLVRTRGEPMAMAEAVRRKIHQVEPARSVYEMMPLEQHLSDALAENRLRTELLTFFALTAVSLACIGLYGTLSYVVSIRRREVGLRLAMGAARRQIVLQFLREALRVSLFGCAAGLILAALFTRVLNGMLYGVSSLDALTFGGVAILMLLTAALSAWMPAMRAAQLEPMQVLREE